MPHSLSYRRILHRMGYYTYQHSLIVQHVNQENGWNSHLGKCRNFILRAVEEIRPSTITVLGSGWLLDLPVAEITENGVNICLIDIIHPPEVVEQTAQMQGVEISEQDLSGGLIKEVWSKAGRRTFFSRLPSLESIMIPEYIPSGDPGMIISLNILTQLEALPEKMLRRKSKATEDEFLSFRKEIQEKHIALLKKYPSVLISDISETKISPDGNVTEKTTLLAALPEGKMKEEWDWDFDLKHAGSYSTRSKFRIIAVVL